jgi:hypothetical protein
MIQAAIRRGRLASQCVADGVTRGFEPHWLDFLAFEPDDTRSVLWFDRERAWRKAGKPADRLGVPVPDRAENVVLSLEQCIELWPDASWLRIPTKSPGRSEMMSPGITR